MAPTPPQPEPEVRPPLLPQVASAVVIYGLILLLTHLLGSWWVSRRLAEQHPILGMVSPERRQALLQLVVLWSVPLRAACLSVPLLLLALVARWRQDRDPLATLGFRFGAALLELPAGIFQGAMMLWLALISLAVYGDSVMTIEPSFLKRLAAATIEGIGARGSHNEWLVLLALALPYAVARLVVSHGYLFVLVGDRCHPALRALLVGGVFIIAYRASGLITPLAVANLLVLGLVLERYRSAHDALWRPLGILAGWMAMGQVLGQAHQGVPQLSTITVFERLPALLSGGAYGPEGGLAVTLVLALWLVLLLWPTRRPTKAERRRQRREAVRQILEQKRAAANQAAPAEHPPAAAGEADPSAAGQP